MTLTFNSAVYNNLLLKVTPKVIENELEYERTLAIVEELTFHQNRTPEQIALHKLLVMLVEAYETENYPGAQPSPNEILRHIMEASGTRQIDLVGILGSSDVVSDIVDGKREVSETQAQILADFFKTSPSLFSR